MKPPKTIASSILVATLLFAAPASSTHAQRPQGQNAPETPAAARRDAICFAYYTVHKGVLKLTAQLYPLQDGEDREVKLAVKDGAGWKTIATTHVTEQPYNNYRQDKTWTAHFRVEKWSESRTVPYRVTALDGVAAYEGTVRANPVGKREIVVAVYTGNSNQDRRLKPDLIANPRAASDVSAGPGGRDGKSRAGLSPSAHTRRGPLFERKRTSVRPASISLKMTKADARVA